jgi:RimK family alpha-L-glutamate ligase
MKPFNDGVIGNDSLREERKGKKAVLTFGRFNPPTSGHELLVNKLVQEAKKRGADNYVFASQSQDSKKNPLDPKTKTDYLKSFFKKSNIIYNTKIRTIFDAIRYLRGMGYTDIAVMVGGDRTAEFESRIRPFVDHSDPDKSLNLDNFEVLSAGAREASASAVRGMSASKLRAAVAQDDFDTFRMGLPSTAKEQQAKKLYKTLRKNMGINEELKMPKRPTPKPRVLMFSGYSEENEGNLMKTARRVKEECDARNVECFVAFVPFARSVKNKDGTRTVINKDGKKFVADRQDTIVVVRGAAAGNSGTLDTISAFEKDGFFVINNREAIEICSDKFRTAITLSEGNLPTPKTALVTDVDDITDIHGIVGGNFPVVAKTIRGSKGKGVFIIDSEKSLKSVMEAIHSIDEDQEIILQEFIPMENDLRIIVLDGKVTAVMSRGKVKKDFRSNFSLGGNVDEVEISPEIEKLALDAAKLIGCYYCGVDICESKKTKKPFILEVNSSPGSEGIEEATNDNVVGDFVDHILERKNWRYSPTVVGRREMITVGGIGDVVAKFDTGNMVVNSIHCDQYKVKGDTVIWSHHGKTYRSKLFDQLTVLQGAIAANKERRPMILLDMEFLGVKYPRRRFTLDDRKNKGTDVLIGVPFMRSNGIVVDPAVTFMKTDNPEMVKEEKVPAAILAIATTLANHPNFARILRKFKHKGRKFSTFLAGTPAFLHIVKRIIPQMSKMETDDILNIIDVAKNIAEGGSQLLMMGEERTLTKKARIYRDSYAEKLKKGDTGKEFKQRYGDDYKDAIFGTATNMAFKMMDKKPTEFLKKEGPKQKKRIEKEEELDKKAHEGNLEGTPELTKKYKKMTPGQVNEVADTYFNKGGSR